LYCKGIKGTFDEGFTVNEEPTAIHKSDFAASLNAFKSSSLESFSPKYMIESRSSPLQF
jgi:hypothetical protein